MLDGVVLHLAAHLRDLEPVEMAQGAGGSLDAVADGLVDALGRGADDLGDTVRAVCHDAPQRLGAAVFADRRPGRGSWACVVAARRRTVAPCAGSRNQSGSPQRPAV